MQEKTMKQSSYLSLISYRLNLPNRSFPFTLFPLRNLNNVKVFYYKDYSTFAL